MLIGFVLSELQTTTIMQLKLSFLRLTMPALNIKNIPAPLYQQLKAIAKLHRRSINSEVLFCLEKILTPTKITPVERLSRLEQLRSSIKDSSITAEQIAQAINSGRLISLF